MSGYVRASLRLAIYRRDAFECLYCEFRADRLRLTVQGTHPELELDHVHPQVRGGSSVPWNLVTCCLSCNDLKHGKDLEEFILQVSLDSSRIQRELYLRRRRRTRRGRKDALMLMKVLQLQEEARCPWCPSTCPGCFSSLAKVRMTGEVDACPEG